ncbi:MAG: DUF624 domain-containing protein [Ruminococcaceae bacterium]|nr:DUF624 domain-containing protein [Oscillospiraceae bacterium]
MGWLFDINNPIMRWIVKIFDCVCLSILWVAACLPVFTVGAATTALFAVIHRYIRLEEGGLLKTFFQAFRENFKRSTLCWFVVLLILALLAVDVLVFRTMAINGQFLGKLYWLMMLLIAVVATWMAYLFCYAERFDGNTKDVLKLSFLLMVLHPVKAVLVLLILLAGAALVVIGPVALSIVPALACWLCDFVIAGVFSQHLREEDRQRLEEKRKAMED